MSEKQDIIWCKDNKEFITLYYQRNKYDIEVDNIEYIKAYGGEAEFHTGNMKFRRKISLNEIENLLEDNKFFRVNKSYIVNIAMIEEYKNETIIVCDVKIGVSQRKKKNFEKAYIEYILKDYAKVKTLSRHTDK